MLQVVYRGRSLCNWLTVEKIRHIALLRQPHHFPGFDWLLASRTTQAQCTNILSLASQGVPAPPLWGDCWFCFL